MAYRPEPNVPNAPPYDPPYADPYRPLPEYDRALHGAYEGRHEAAERPDIPREVTAGPYRFGMREGILGSIGVFAILGVVLGVLGFAAAFALRDMIPLLTDANPNNDFLIGANAIPALLVGLLPFMAAPVLALGLGAWTGHASREAGIGASAGAIGGFLGPIMMLLITGIGFALGAGAASLDLSNVRVVWGIAPGWGTTIPYLFTGAGLLWLVANTLAGGLSGGLVGGLLEHRWSASSRRRAVTTRRTTRL